MNYLPYILILPFYFFCPPTDFESWRLAVDKKGVKIFYKPIKIDQRKARSMRINLFASTSNEEIIDAVKYEQQLKEWMPNLESSIILEETDESWIAFQTFNFPWPFEKKYCQVEYRIIRSNEDVLRIESERIEPTMDIQAYKKYGEMDYFISIWEANSTEKESPTQISYQSTSHAVPKLPRWIQDPIIQKVLVGSFVQFKDLIQ